MLLTCSIEQAHPVANEISWTMDNLIQVHREAFQPGVPACSSLAKSSIGVTGVAFFLANSSAERNNRNKAKHCITDCRRPPRWHHHVAPWRYGMGVTTLKAAHVTTRFTTLASFAEFKLEHIQKMMRWHRGTQLYSYQWCRYRGRVFHLRPCFLETVPAPAPF